MKMIQSSLFCSKSSGFLHGEFAGKKHNREFLSGSSYDLPLVFINDIAQKAVLLCPDDKEVWDAYESICNMSSYDIEKSGHIKWKKQKALYL